MNKVDNFRIDYLDKEGASLKGSINCAGYKTQKVDGDEHGFDMILVEPISYDLRLVKKVMSGRMWSTMLVKKQLPPKIQIGY
jgi:hypothetical protein